MERVISYQKLRSTTESVINFVEEFTGTSNLLISDNLEQDIQITGDDISELLEAFSNKFQVDLEGLKFNDYFHGEAEISIWLPINFMFIALYLFVNLLQAIFAVCCFLFNRNFGQQLWDFDTLKPSLSFSFSNKTPFAIGDLIACAIEKRFVMRHAIQFKLTQNNEK